MGAVDIAKELDRGINFQQVRADTRAQHCSRALDCTPLE
jgi:hypothetical protein